MQYVIEVNTIAVELVGSRSLRLHYGMHTKTVDDPQSWSAGMEMNMLWPTGPRSLRAGV
jgi:hypothetical protein